MKMIELDINGKWQNIIKKGGGGGSGGGGEPDLKNKIGTTARARGR